MVLLYTFYSSKSPGGSRLRRPHCDTQHSQQDSSGRVTSPTQRPLPDHTPNTQKRQTEKNLSRIRTRNPSKQAAADPALDRAANGMGKLLSTNANIKLRVNIINYGSRDVLLSAIGQEVSLPHYVIPFTFFTPDQYIIHTGGVLSSEH